MSLPRASALALVAVSFVPIDLACSSPVRLPLSLLQDPDAPIGESWHRGPSVAGGDTGPARFVPKLHEAFRTKRAMDLVRFIDGFYRAPANPYYDAVLDRLYEELAKAGFGSQEGLVLRFVQDDDPENAWTPKSGEVVLFAPGESPRTLHAFSAPSDVDRVMLPVNCPPCDVEGPVATHLEHVEEGSIFVTDVPVSQAMRAHARGAVAIVVGSVETYNADPSGKDRHKDAIQFSTLPRRDGLPPIVKISPRSFEIVHAVCDAAEASGGEVRMRVRADVETSPRPLRTLVAEVVGAGRPDEAVVVVSHVQEPGACDNASGVAGLAESARCLAELLRDSKLDWPDRTVAFVWGDEFRQSEAWLRSSQRTCVAGFSSDMTGQSKDTGAIALLERMPDPGALVPLAPDRHTPWGAGAVGADDLRPNGLAVLARCAMIDVGALEGGWTSADHPWEGGSDHDVFIDRGVPAVLFWHFTDFTYHTSLDRLEFVDETEIRRTGVALLAAALAVASPAPDDLDRYLRSLKLEEDLRVDAAQKAGNDELVGQWQAWCLGAREWLRNQCLGIEEEIPR